MSYIIIDNNGGGHYVLKKNYQLFLNKFQLVALIKIIVKSQLILIILPGIVRNSCINGSMNMYIIS